MINQVVEFSFMSSSKLCNICGYAYLPKNDIKIKGVIQIAHGMAEHHLRYEDFISFLNANGYIVYINDHLGHGSSIKNKNELGYFGKKDGYIHLVNDMKTITDIIHKQYPDLPVVLFGHSMGSMLARLYSEKYGDNISAAIYCGTCGKNPAAPVGVSLVRSIASIKGDFYRSQFVNKLAFGTYNNRITTKRTSFDWLTTDNSVVDKYIADPYCGFLFTAKGYLDLMNLIIVINRPDWYTAVPCELPIYLMAGDADPVGNYGKGVKEVYQALVDSKHSDVSWKLFKGDRHEILNEKDKTEVYNNVLSWLSTIIE